MMWSGHSLRKACLACCMHLITFVARIPKTRKHLNDLSNFRSISLISVFIRIINLMVMERLMGFLKRGNINPVCSYVHQKRKSTTLCVSKVSFLIASLKKAGKIVVLLSLDNCEAW